MKAASGMLLCWHTLIPVVVLLICVILAVKERNK